MIAANGTVTHEEQLEPGKPIKIHWQLTRDPVAEEIRCDLCGNQADTIHFIPGLTDCQAAIFACPDHCPVPQGYMIDTERWFCDGGPEMSSRHLTETKRDGPLALAMLYDRLEQIKRDLANSAVRAAGKR